MTNGLKKDDYPCQAAAEEPQPVDVTNGVLENAIIRAERQRCHAYELVAQVEHLVDHLEPRQEGSGDQGVEAIPDGLLPRLVRAQESIDAAFERMAHELQELRKRL